MPAAATNSRPRDSEPEGPQALRWPLHSLGQRIRFLAAGLLAVALYVGVVAADYASKVLAGSLVAERVALAARLDPLNAAYQHILGRISFYEQQDVPAAIQHYSAAAHLNPYSARYWLDLANVQQIDARVEDSRKALEHALAADPTNPQVANEAANYYLVLGDVPSALRLLALVVRYSPEDQRSAVELSWRATQDAGAVMGQVLPQTTDSYLIFLHLLMARRQTEAADQVWRALMDSKQNIAPDSAFPYIDYLLEQREAPRAWAAWQQLVRRQESMNRYPVAGNLVTNPGFEEDILNGGFGWRYESNPHVALGVDQRDAYRGGRSLSVSFDGEAVRDAGIGQLLVVQPDTTYLLSAWARSEDIQGAGGPQLAVFDRYSGARLYLSDELSGGQGWRKIEGEFHTPSDAQLVALRMVRVPGTTRIRGRVWLDEVSVVRK